MPSANIVGVPLKPAHVCCRQVCKSGLGHTRKLWLTRHGESLYNQQALIGGDSDLSPNGEAYARLLPQALASRLPNVSRKLRLPSRP
jgi:Histidine phosphatase superfamily (branch 1)